MIGRLCLPTHTVRTKDSQEETRKLRVAVTRGTGDPAWDESTLLGPAFSSLLPDSISKVQGVAFGVSPPDSLLPTPLPGASGILRTGMN